jgi:mannitol 2-dehydrogenase
VLEDNFCAGRPDWDKVGATFTNDVDSFEKMKIRILNGGHQLIADAGEILSVKYISECMDHPMIGDFFRKVAKSEIILQVDAVPDMTPEAYVDLIDCRFSNSKILDTVRRVAFDGSSRQAQFILPTLREALAMESPADGLVLSQAIWARMCEGSREDGTMIKSNDPIWDKLNTAAKGAKSDPQVWLNQSDFYGDLAENVIFRDRFRHWLMMIWSDGVEATLRSYLEG